MGIIMNKSMNKVETPVLYAGRMSFCNAGGVDVGALEAHSKTFGFLRGIKVKKGMYDCHYAIGDNGRIGAMMIVHVDYESEMLVAEEKIGEFNVGLSGVVGFFSSPKTEYTMNQLGEYLKQLEKDHPMKTWHVLNSRQFMAPCYQAPSTFVGVYAHRNKSGEIDALQIEFNRQENDLLKKGGEKQ